MQTIGLKAVRSLKNSVYAISSAFRTILVTVNITVTYSTQRRNKKSIVFAPGGEKIISSVLIILIQKGLVTCLFYWTNF